MCTDAKYNYHIILQRWRHVEQELRKIGITVTSNGVDGAGPFLKAMASQNGLFNRNYEGNVPRYWTFYSMPQLHDNSLACQDIIHLLAKLRTRLLTPSNLIVVGVETACCGHLLQVLKSFSKSYHGLTHQVLENKDKQNYESIEKLLGIGVEECLKKISVQTKTKGTVVYLWIMRNIRDAFFNKSISPLERISLVWKTVFFLRFWRLWLYNNGYSEANHFITQNAYICIEFNSHLILNIVVNVINKTFPPENVSTVQKFCLAELSSSPISKEAKRKDNTPVPT